MSVLFLGSWNSWGCLLLFCVRGVIVLIFMKLKLNVVNVGIVCVFLFSFVVRFSGDLKVCFEGVCFYSVCCSVVLFGFCVFGIVSVWVSWGSSGIFEVSFSLCRVRWWVFLVFSWNSSG